ncbi:hypothetical protein JOF53_005663 [Crossiella equi]|uniref:Uncharacterized protein n=1 Tax=Crossiella equi TaxID=130796 RepID=A0ABS5AJP2_9PSEU|nr:hypothetical protein [Crossiella equi]MBP2476791.1 hypothetical protein [Crossiella equi]
MHTDELTKILTAAASTVDVRPGFTDRVREGGRRRRRRRRLAIVAAALSTAGLLGFGSLTWEFLSRLPADAIAADARFSQSALGGRAADEALQTDARTVFTRDWPRSRLKSWYALKQSDTPQVELTGAPHVYWAGDTPAGPAVVLLHRATKGGSDTTLIALVGKDARTGQSRLLGVHVPDGPSHRTAVFQFGQDDRQLLGVAEDRLTWSYVTLADRGELTRSSVTEAVTDGVVLAALPTTAPAQQVQVGQNQNMTTWLSGELATTNTWHLDLPPEASGNPGLPPRDYQRWAGNLGGKALPPAPIRGATIESLGERALRDGPYYDPMASTQAPNWTMTTALRNGRALYLAELSTPGARARVVGVVFDRDASVETVVWAWVEPGSYAAAHLRLPDQEGWLVLTEKGATVRSSAAPASNVAQDTDTEGWALLPPDTQAAVLTGKGRAEQSLPLR